MTIDQLPTFTINRLEHGRAIGTFDKPLWIGERHLGDLLLPDEQFVSGRFVNVDLQSHSAAFVPTAAEDISKLLPGMTYSRFDGYWGERAALVLDRQRRWSQRVFEPVDAVTFKRRSVTLVGKVTNQNLPEGGRVIKGGWDHEHCSICWETISPQTDPIAMFSEPDHWVCRKCYENFVVPRSLDFIYVKDSGH
ncbi:MAG: hypothetical protein KA383_01415 [Phycisphaerae bacterium]|nr:hypothetical protein [Phycisphaerae bacterium]